MASLGLFLTPGLGWMGLVWLTGLVTAIVGGGALLPLPKGWV